jgi:hypothetical protein
MASRKRKSEEGVAPAPAATATTASTNKKKSGTIKDKILAIVAASDELVSSIRIKKLLVSEYGIAESSAFNTNVNKTLKGMGDELDQLRDVFGKIGGSYHGGINSKPYLDHVERTEKEEEMKAHRMNDETFCCYCNQWNKSTFIREDSVARGGLVQCVMEGCGKEYFVWISDDYLYGHEVEYRYGHPHGRLDYGDRR